MRYLGFARRFDAPEKLFDDKNEAMAWLLRQDERAYVEDTDTKEVSWVEGKRVLTC